MVEKLSLERFEEQCISSQYTSLTERVWNIYPLVTIDINLAFLYNQGRGETYRELVKNMGFANASGIARRVLAAQIASKQPPDRTYPSDRKGLPFADFEDFEMHLESSGMSLPLDEISSLINAFTLSICHTSVDTARKRGFLPDKSTLDDFLAETAAWQLFLAKAGWENGRKTFPICYHESNALLPPLEYLPYANAVYNLYIHMLPDLIGPHPGLDITIDELETQIRTVFTFFNRVKIFHMGKALGLKNVIVDTKEDPCMEKAEKSYLDMVENKGLPIASIVQNIDRITEQTLNDVAEMLDVYRKNVRLIIPPRQNFHVEKISPGVIPTARDLREAISLTGKDAITGGDFVHKVIPVK